MVFAFLVMLAFVLIGLRRSVLRYLFPLALPLLFIPAAERLLRWPLEWVRSPGGSRLLGTLVLAHGWWAVREPPPLRAR